MSLNTTVTRIETEILGALAVIRFSENYTTIAASAAVLLLTTVVVLRARAKKYAAVPYDVTVPDQCKPGWDGKVLESPSIRVCV